MQEEPKNYWQPEDVPQTPPSPVNPAPAAPVTPQPLSAQEVPAVPPQPVASPLPEPAEAPVIPVTPGVYTEEPQAPPQSEQPSAPIEPITWTAEEYVHPDKGVGWYVVLTLVALALIAVDVFFLKSWTFSALVVVMFVALIVYIRRPARTLTYSLSPAQGLYVGETLHPFEEFKSFGIIQDGTHNSIMLIPRKRFGTGVSVFFPDEAGEVIVDILGQRLPMENLKLDVVDTIVRKLRL